MTSARARSSVAILLALPFLAAFEWPGRVLEVARRLHSADPETRREAVAALATHPVADARAYVLEAIEDPDPAVREAAARVSGRLRLVEAATPLAGWLSDPEASLRAVAAESLGEIGDAHAVGGLTRALGDSEPAVRRAAVAALGRMEATSQLVPILGRLDDPDASVRSAAAEVLSRIGDRGAVLPLVGHVSDTDSDVRQRVIAALGSLGDPRASPALLQALRDPSADIRGAAASALARLRDPTSEGPLGALTSDADAAVRRRATVALGALGGPDAIEVLVRLLDRPDLQRDAVDALVRIGPPAVPALAARMTALGGDAATSPPEAAAAEAIGRVGDPAATPALVEALHAGRVAPDRLLGAIGMAADERALVPVLERLESPDPGIRLAAALCLDRLLARVPAARDGRAAEPLLARLSDPSPPVRVLAVGLVGRVGARRAGPRLQEIATGPPGELRDAAIGALASIGDAGALPTLLRLLEDRDARTRFRAARAIGDLAPERAAESLESLLGSGRPVDPVAVLAALGRSLRAHPSPRAAGRLARRARGRDEHLALHATDALTQSRAPEAIGALVWRLRSPDPAWRAKAADALGAFETSSVRRALSEALDDEDPAVRAASAWALGHVGGRADLPRLAARLGDDGWGVAMNAATAIGRIGSPDAATTRALCTAAERRDAPTRAAAVLAAATVGAACGAPEALTRILAHDPSPLVRSAAARGLGRDPGSASRLRDCASTDADEEVAAACAAATVPLGAATSWTEFYYWSADGRRLRPRARYLLVLPDGTIKAGVTDANAVGREEDIPEGEVRVIDPEA